MQQVTKPEGWCSQHNALLLCLQVDRSTQTSSVRWPSLLECGDIEANPGPRSRRSCNLSRCVVWNLNTNGSSNAWDFLLYAAEQKIDIMSLQEVGMSDPDHVAFKRKAWHLGCAAIRSPGTCFNQGRGRHFWGGVVTVHAHAFSIPGQGGQAVACWIDGTLLRADSQNALVLLSGDASAMGFDVDFPLQPVWNWLCRILAEIKWRHDHADPECNVFDDLHYFDVYPDSSFYYFDFMLS